MSSLQAMSGELPEGAKVTLADLETVKVIGTGTFGKVTVVAHRTTRFIYALKSMRKTDIVKLKQVEHVANEKTILKASRHPFIVRMYVLAHAHANLSPLWRSRGLANGAGG